jgi:hypothetical protein
MRITLPISADAAIELINAHGEISWATGQHFADPSYEVGCYLTAHEYGEYTDHPDYSGVNFESRTYDETLDQWVYSWRNVLAK